MIIDWSFGSALMAAANIQRAKMEAEYQLHYQTLVKQAQDAAARHEMDIAEARLGKVIDGEFVDVTNERLLTKD